MSKNKEDVLHRVEFVKFRDPIKRFLDKNSSKHNEEHSDMEEENIGANEFRSLDNYSGPIIQTDFGIIPLHESNLLSVQFNLWTGYTNFQLQKQHAYILDTTPGIEIAMIKTPYRFLIGIAKLFSEQDVLSRLKKNLVESMRTSGFISGSLKESLAKQYKFFAIINFEGKNHVLHGNSMEEVETQIENFTKKNGQQAIEKSY